MNNSEKIQKSPVIKIGIFDSGVGGLTVAKQIKTVLPNVPIIYIGDTARVPWGVRSPKTIKLFSLQLLKFLEKRKVDFVIAACHTASAVALQFLKGKTKLPVVGVIEPTVESLLKNTTGRVGILGTMATIRSRAWENALKKKRLGIRVFQRPAPLLVPIVEEGLEDDEIATLMIRRYTKPLLEKGIDTLVLACTHYPLLERTFRKVIGLRVEIVKPGKEVARKVKELIGTKQIRNTKYSDEFYFTDLGSSVIRRVQRFYGKKLVSKTKEISVENL